MLIVHEDDSEPRLRTCVCEIDPSTEADGNASLIVAAFNSATACADMGYDGIKAVEALPEALTVLRDELHAIGLWLNADLEPDVRDGIRISISKIESVLAQAGQKQLSPQ